MKRFLCLLLFLTGCAYDGNNKLISRQIICVAPHYSVNGCQNEEDKNKIYAISDVGYSFASFMFDFGLTLKDKDGKELFVSKDVLDKDDESREAYQFLDEYQKELERMEKEKQNRLKNEARKKERLADCQQAKEKAKKRAREIGIDKNDTQKFTTFSGFGATVEEFLADGVIIKKDCGAIKAFGWWLFVDNADSTGCKKEYVIYTNDKNYGTHEDFRDKGLLYQRVEHYHQYDGTYLPAYKETPYKISDVDYHTYLKDKTIKECPK